MQVTAVARLYAGTTDLKQKMQAIKITSNISMQKERQKLRSIPCGPVSNIKYMQADNQ